MNEVYVITGITDPFEDKREVLAVVDSKEQAELAECYYSNICSDIEIEHSKIVHFDADEIYYKIWFKIMLYYTEKGFRYSSLDYFSCDKIYGSFKEFFEMRHTTISHENKKAEYMITGFFTVKEVPATTVKRVKLITDFINNNFTEFTEKHGKIERVSLDVD